MVRKVSVETRQERLKVIGERFRGGTRDEKLRILDEFVAVTGYHRKHAIRLFRAGSAAGGGPRRSRLRLYDEAVREALVVLWEASDWVCVLSSSRRRATSCRSRSASAWSCVLLLLAATPRAKVREKWAREIAWTADERMRAGQSFGRREVSADRGVSHEPAPGEYSGGGVERG